MKDMFARLSQINPAKVTFPDKKAKEGQKVVGVLPDDLKRYWGFLSLITEESNERIKRLKGDLRARAESHEVVHREEKNTSELCAAHIQQMQLTHTEIEVLREEMQELYGVFWKLVRLEFGALNAHSVAIIAGGEVAITEAPSVEAILSGIGVIEIFGGNAFLAHLSEMLP